MSNTEKLREYIRTGAGGQMSRATTALILEHSERLDRLEQRVVPHTIVNGDLPAEVGRLQKRVAELESFAWWVAWDVIGPADAVPRDVLELVKAEAKALMPRNPKPQQFVPHTDDATEEAS